MGAVPPETVRSIAPLEPPLQVTLVTVVLRVGPLVLFTVTLVVAVQPLASVTVTV